MTDFTSPQSVDLDVFNQIMHVNYTAAVTLATAFLPYLSGKTTATSLVLYYPLRVFLYIQANIKEQHPVQPCHHTRSPPDWLLRIQGCFEYICHVYAGSTQRGQVQCQRDRSLSTGCSK